LASAGEHVLRRQPEVSAAALRASPLAESPLQQQVAWEPPALRVALVVQASQAFLQPQAVLQVKAYQAWRRQVGLRKLRKREKEGQPGPEASPVLLPPDSIPQACQYSTFLVRQPRLICFLPLISWVGRKQAERLAKQGIQTQHLSTVNGGFGSYLRASEGIFVGP